MARLVINCTKDAEIYSGSPNANYNNDTLWCGTPNVEEYYRSLLFFDLSSLAGKQITRAALEIYYWHGWDTTLNFSVNCIPQNWSETGVTWNNKPDYSTTAAVSLSLASLPNNQWREFNITSLITDIVNNGRAYYGIYLRQPGTTLETLKFFMSREFDGGWAAPQLIVDYVGGLKAKVSGAWKDTDTYAKVSGVWRQCEAYTKVNGVWKQGT